MQIIDTSKEKQINVLVFHKLERALIKGATVADFLRELKPAGRITHISAGNVAVSSLWPDSGNDTCFCGKICHARSTEASCL